MTRKICVIGGGPGGYVTAIRAAQLGIEVTLIEKDQLGGVCLNWGCIPTKALLKSAETYYFAQHMSDLGVHAKGVSFDLAKMVERSRSIAGQLSKGVTHLLKKNKVKVITGHARLAGTEGTQRRVEVVSEKGETKAHLFSDVILATGARARVLDGVEPDGKKIWNSSHAMIQKQLPKRLVVVGSGAIGMEFTSFYNMLGSEVTIVEVQDRILAYEDEETSSFMQTTFEKRGVQFLSKTALEKVEHTKTGLTLTLKTEKGTTEEKACDALLVAAGIVGNSENLGLETTSVRTEKGHIVTNERYETGEANVYAIGDVVQGPWFAHKASHEGILLTERLAGLHERTLDPHQVPRCMYMYPQVGSLGFTEKQAREQGLAIRIGRFPFFANGKALTIGHSEGFIKTIVDEKTGALLGVHMVGPDVTELIYGLGLAHTLEATEEEIFHTMFPHPTLSEGIQESVLGAFGHAIHI